MQPLSRILTLVLTGATLLAPQAYAVTPEQSAPPLFPAEIDAMVLSASSITAGSTTYLKVSTVEFGDRLHVVRDGEARFIKDISPAENPSARGFSRLGEKLFFFENDSLHGSEPWITDGTAEGTYLLKDILPGPASSEMIYDYSWLPPERRIAIEYGGEVFFLAKPESSSVSLWRTDGTTAGTRQVTGASNLSSPSAIAVFDGKLFIALSDGIAYLSSPDADMSYLPLPLITLETGESVVTDFLHPEYGFSATSSRLYFLGRGSGGKALWSIASDEPGILLETLIPAAGSFWSSPAATDGAAYFVTREGNQEKLWQYLAIDESIQLVADRAEGIPSDLEIPVTGATNAFSYSRSTKMIWVFSDGGSITPLNGELVVSKILGILGDSVLFTGTYQARSSLLSSDKDTLAITAINTDSSESYDTLLAGELASYAFSSTFYSDHVHVLHEAQSPAQRITIATPKSARIRMDSCHANDRLSFWLRENSSNDSFTINTISTETHPQIALSRSSEEGEYLGSQAAVLGSDNVFFDVRHDSHNLIYYLDTNQLDISPLTSLHDHTGHFEFHRMHGTTSDGSLIYSYRTPDSSYALIKVSPDQPEEHLATLDDIPFATQLIADKLYLQLSSLFRFDINTRTLEQILDETGAPLRLDGVIFGKPESGLYARATGNTPAINATWSIPYENVTAHPVTSSRGPLVWLGGSPPYAVAGDSNFIGSSNEPGVAGAIWTHSSGGEAQLLLDLNQLSDTAKPVSIFVIDDTLFVFLQPDAFSPIQIWRMHIDGTGFERVMTTDAVPLELPYYEAHAISTGMVLVGQDSVHGAEPWFVPTGNAPALLIADINPGPAHSRAEFCGSHYETLLINAYDVVNGKMLRALAPPEPEPEVETPSSEKDGSGVIFFALFLLLTLRPRAQSRQVRPAQ